jgi:hypothetical protein
MILKSTLTSAKVQANVKRAPKPTDRRIPTTDQVRRSSRSARTKASSELELDIPASSSQALTERFKAWKMISLIILIGIAGLFYVNHVFQTQAVLTEVSALERDYERVRRIHADRKFQFERLTGPAEVQRRASQQGLIHGGAAEGVIIVKP